MDTIVSYMLHLHHALTTDPHFALYCTIAIVPLLTLFCIRKLPLITSSRDDVLVQNHIASRNKLLAAERKIRTGGKIKLSQKELRVNTILMSMKDTEFKSGLRGDPFPPAMHFILAKPLIETSKVFDIIKMMPKGAALHLHGTGVVNVRWVISELTYLPSLYYYQDAEGPEKMKRLHFRFFADIPLEPMEKCTEWKLLADARRESGDASQFDEWLYHNFTMITKDPLHEYPDTNKAWDKFGLCLFNAAQFLYSEECFEKYSTRALQEFYDDNVQYMEIRYGINSRVRSMNNASEPQDQEYTLQKYITTVQKFTESHSDFVGVKFIGTSVRLFDHDVIEDDIRRSLRYQKTYPEYYAGHDLVIQEDKGHPLLHYINELILPMSRCEKLPFFFHAGETSWQGTFVDENLIDAILLGAKRIGHGFAVTKHPVAMEMIKSKGIAIEVNPISNQVLGLIDDLRNHPAASLLAQDFPVAISSDDPAPWGAAPMSHDFYMTFMSLGGKAADLATLKQLALNSIKYSATTEIEKARIVHVWTKKWDSFLDEVIAKYGSEYLA